MRGEVDLPRILDLIFNPTPVNDAMGEVFFFSSTLAQSRLVHAQSQRSCLGSGIPSLVGGFGSKVIKRGAGSSLSTSSGSREG